MTIFIPKKRPDPPMVASKAVVQTTKKGPAGKAPPPPAPKPQPKVPPPPAPTPQPKHSKPGSKPRPKAVKCRAGLNCTRPNCKFMHPEGFVEPCYYHWVRKSCHFGDGCRYRHGDNSAVVVTIGGGGGGGGGGSGAAAGAADDSGSDDDANECQICACSRPNQATLACCGQRLCYGCIKTMLKGRDTVAAELMKEYQGRAHQCPKCSFGPVEHFACSSLSGSSHNRCPKCDFYAHSLSAWVPWDGTLPPSFASMAGTFACPFCRKETPASSAFGTETKFCTKCMKLGHTRAMCTYKLCTICGKGGHEDGECHNKLQLCPRCKKPGHGISKCPVNGEVPPVPQSRARRITPLPRVVLRDSRRDDSSRVHRQPRSRSPTTSRAPVGLLGSRGVRRQPRSRSPTTSRAPVGLLGSRARRIGSDRFGGGLMRPGSIPVPGLSRQTRPLSSSRTRSPFLR